MSQPVTPLTQEYLDIMKFQAVIKAGDLIHRRLEDKGIECPEEDAAVFCYDLAQEIVDTQWPRTG